MKNFSPGPRVGASFDMGTFTVPKPEGGFGSGTRIVLRIGKLGQAAQVELTTGETFEAPTTFTWNPDAAETYGTIVTDLAYELLAPLGADIWPYYYQLLTADDQPVDIEGAEGSIKVRAAILAKAS